MAQGTALLLIQRAHFTLKPCAKNAGSMRNLSCQQSCHRTPNVARNPRVHHEAALMPGVAAHTFTTCRAPRMSQSTANRHNNKLLALLHPHLVSIGHEHQLPRHCPAQNLRKQKGGKVKLSIRVSVILPAGHVYCCYMVCFVQRARTTTSPWHTTTQGSCTEITVPTKSSKEAAMQTYMPNAHG